MVLSAGLDLDVAPIGSPMSRRTVSDRPVWCLLAREGLREGVGRVRFRVFDEVGLLVVSFGDRVGFAWHPRSRVIVSKNVAQAPIGDSLRGLCGYRSIRLIQQRRVHSLHEAQRLRATLGTPPRA